MDTGGLLITDLAGSGSYLDIFVAIENNSVESLINTVVRIRIRNSRVKDPDP
jgi:hypothetical protein